MKPHAVFVFLPSRHRKEDIMQKVKRRLMITLIILAIITALYAWGFAMKPVYYDVRTDKLDTEIRVVFISDLHNCYYEDKKQSKLIEAVNKNEPDIVIIGGDVVDAWGGDQHAVKLVTELSKSYPCFYTPGNHEEMRKDKKEFYKKISSICPMLTGNYEQLTVKGQDIRIYGVIDNYTAGKHGTQLNECFASLDENYYNILIAHQPEQINSYLASDRSEGKYFDLVLSGHAHGGQWRLPYILDQGLYAPDQGILPDYTSGMYEYDETVHIISRGLARPARMIFIPRIFNRPELSVINIG